MGEMKEKPVYKRQRFLLEFIRQLGNGATVTDIQKLVFLYSQLDCQHFYDFIPYLYGPYSFQLADDIDILLRDRFISYNDPIISAAGDRTDATFFSLPSERGEHLIKTVYKRYPYYAINSEILNRLFQGHEVVLFHLEREKLKKKEERLFTIGYEGRSFESFINTLIKNDIRLLCDVRRNPLSRKFGFSKSKLKHVLEKIGIKYTHIPEVGIDSEKRASLNSIDDYESLFRNYVVCLPRIARYLDYIETLLKDNQRIALMCYEKNPRICHRHIISDYLIKNYHAVCEDL